MAHILLIETATNICSVAITHGEEVIATRQSIGEHAAKITILIAECLAEAHLKPTQLNAVAVSSGPGSYTSLRVGTSAAKGICFALDIPLIAVDTLESLAHAARKTNQADFFAPMIDARRMEVYTKLFDKNIKIISPQEAKIITDESFLELLDQHKVVFCGDGAAKCRQIITHTNAIFAPNECHALHLAALAFDAFTNGQFADTAYYTPNYLKPPNITTPKLP